MSEAVTLVAKAATEVGRAIGKPQADSQSVERQRRPPAFPPPWAVAWGDDRFGLWAELQANGVVQRMRWIEPGEFWMGSEPEEKGHQAREAPRHRVHLTAGFWLADTACTQGLWVAVMEGKNPSQFKDDTQNPVEQVTWDDVEVFLRRLTGVAEGDEAHLPTEAQWEYACRAGTQTPFYLGESIHTSQVNFSGKWEYSDKETTLGAAHGQTLPVKSFAPNTWGLYEMHGNVLEWCSDSGQRQYEKSEVSIEDPQGPAKPGPEAPRALRGGSWFGPARGARSAYRSGGGSGVRGRGLGFRLALRSGSTGPGPAGPSELKAPEAPSGPAGPRDSVVLAPGRDGPGPAPRRDAGARPAKTGPRPAPPKAQPRKLAKKKVEPR